MNPTDSGLVRITDIYNKSYIINIVFIACIRVGETIDVIEMLSGNTLTVQKEQAKKLVSAFGEDYETLD